jgi:hypothetical protein
MWGAGGVTLLRGSIRALPLYKKAVDLTLYVELGLYCS